MTSVSVDPDNPVLDADQRRAVIDQAIATLDHYVLPQVATQLQALLDTQLQGDSYDDVATAPQLAERLTLELQATSGDRQLQVHFSPQPLPDLSPNRTPPLPSWPPSAIAVPSATLTSTGWSGCGAMWAI
jgi:hypothetical protein